VVRSPGAVSLASLLKSASRSRAGSVPPRGGGGPKRQASSTRRTGRAPHNQAAKFRFRRTPVDGRPIAFPGRDHRLIRQPAIVVPGGKSGSRSAILIVEAGRGSESETVASALPALSRFCGRPPLTAGRRAGASAVRSPTIDHPGRRRPRTIGTRLGRIGQIPLDRGSARRWGRTPLLDIPVLICSLVSPCANHRRIRAARRRCAIGASVARFTAGVPQTGDMTIVLDVVEVVTLATTWSSRPLSRAGYPS